jgi:hypothetical protein
MLFAALYWQRDNVTEQTQKRSLQLFASWSPPFEFRANYSRGDGRGGIAIIESDSVEAIIEGISPWVPFFEVEVTPVMDIQAAVPALQRAYDWRDSIKEVSSGARPIEGVGTNVAA